MGAEDDDVPGKGSSGEGSRLRIIVWRGCAIFSARVASRERGTSSFLAFHLLLGMVLVHTFFHLSTQSCFNF